MHPVRCWLMPLTAATRDLVLVSQASLSHGVVAILATSPHRYLQVPKLEVD